MGLRDREIYRLPNGRELVAFIYATGTPVLYNLQTHGSQTGDPSGRLKADQIHYELNEAGRLSFQGHLTAWGIEDLSDTGRTVSNDFTPIKNVSSQVAGDISNERTY